MPRRTGAPDPGRGSADAVAAGPGGRVAAPALTLSLQFADASHRAVLARHRVARWIRAALAAPAEITVRIVDAEEGRELNRSYRDKDYATNVLTFDYAREPVVVADLVLCAPVVAREAAEQGIGLDAHYAHLLVHGTLHAQGFDHEADADAQRMEARESAILARLGFADPYAGAEAPRIVDGPTS
jgi:probable rRNA maturation factor